MEKIITVQNAFTLALFIALVLSFYMFMQTVIYNNPTHKTQFSSWQMPMLFAIFIDILYVNK